VLSLIIEYQVHIGLLTGLVGTWLAYRAWIEPRRRERQLTQAFGADSFDELQIRRATVGYVAPDCSQLDPAGEDDVRQQFSVRSPLLPEMDKILSDSHEGKHVLLLADSGMGKTSFLLHYYARNRRTRSSKKQRIALLPLGRPDVLERIARIELKRETVIFLDAFDEDTSAIIDHRSRLEELMKACSDFRRVVVSCRTQFFPSDEEVPRQTGIARVSPRKAGEGRIYQFYKLYLAPFSDDQVRRYIQIRFPFWRYPSRKRAYKIVQSIPELSVRPMLLALVPDLVAKQKVIHELYDLYQFMIDSWLERERDWIEPRTLLAFSEYLAVNLFLKRVQRGMERIARNELVELLERNLLNLDVTQLEAWKLTSRSLLNRDGDGNFKFAHRSIMEFLFVSAVSRGRQECLDIEWTDLMRQLFVSWISREVNAGRSNDVQSLLANDFRQTGIFPIFRQPREPERLSKTRSLRTKSRGGLLSMYSGLPNVPRDFYSTSFRCEDARFICDLASDAVFWVMFDMQSTDVEDGHAEMSRLFQFNRSGAALQIETVNAGGQHGRKNWRPPTLEEFDMLVLLQARNPILDPKGYYWSSDRTEAGAWLLINASPGVGDGSRSLELIGKRELKNSTTTGSEYSVFASKLADQPGYTAESLQFRAYLVLVSHGKAEEFRSLVAGRPIKPKKSKRRKGEKPSS